MNSGQPTCFIAMPITTTDEHADTYQDKNHWEHVMESLFVPAIEKAGLEPVRPVTRGSDLIHGEIIRQLSSADMVLCDLSSHNPNVFFELGVRTSLNKPIALVRGTGTPLPFDTAGINTHTYDPALRPWNVEDEIQSLADHIEEAARTCHGENPLWRQFGLTIAAEEPKTDASPTDALLELLAGEVGELRDEVRKGRRPAHIQLPPGRSVAWERVAQDLDMAAAARHGTRHGAETDGAAAAVAIAEAIALEFDLSVELEVTGSVLQVTILEPRPSISTTRKFRERVRELLDSFGWKVNVRRLPPPEPPEAQDGDVN